MRPISPWSLAVPLFALAPAAAPGQQATPAAGTRFSPPPDHWMTIDSLAHAVGLTVEQRGRVAEPYTALNAVMRDAAARRLAVREAMQAALAGRSPQELSEAERAGLRARFDSSRADLEGYQAEADMWHGTIRNLLTPSQQAKFDALPPPVVLTPLRRGGPPPR